MVEFDAFLGFGGEIFVHVKGLDKALDGGIAALLLLRQPLTNGGVGGVGVRHRVQHVCLSRQVLPEDLDVFVR